MSKCSKIVGKSRRGKLTPYEERVAKKLARLKITRPEVDGCSPRVAVTYDSHDVTSMSPAEWKSHNEDYYKHDSIHFKNDHKTPKLNGCVAVKDGRKIIHPEKTFKQGSQDGVYGPGQTRPAVYKSDLKVNNR